MTFDPMFESFLSRFQVSSKATLSHFRVGEPGSHFFSHFHVTLILSCLIMSPFFFIFVPSLGCSHVTRDLPDELPFLAVPLSWPHTTCKEVEKVQDNRDSPEHVRTPQ